MFNINHEEKELPCINMSMKIQGYLLGYSVLQNGIIVKEHKYENPVKNLVVSSGKNYLLTSGGDSNSSLFGYIDAGKSSGVLSYCARGSSTSAAQASDTVLGAQIGNKTSSILPNDPNTGTKYVRSLGKVVMRVTHDHEVESADRNINELGWFGGTSASPVMFSHIILPSTVTVLTGQSLRTVYQLEVSITPITATSCAPSVTGWTTDGDYRWECLFPDTSSFGSTSFPLFSTLSTTGTNQGMSSEAAYSGLQAASSANDGFTIVTMYGSSQSFNTFGTAVTNPTASSTVYNINRSASSGTSSLTLQSYTPGSFYRDVTIVAQANWTGYASISIYAMRLFGLMYIFDNPQTKTNTQRLTLTYRISVS